MRIKGLVIAAIVLTLVFVVIARITGPNFRYSVSQSGDGWTVTHRAPRVITDSDRSTLQVRETGNLGAVSAIRLLGRERTWEPGRFEVCAGVPLAPAGGARAWLFPVDRRPWMTKYDYSFRVTLKDGREVDLLRGGGLMTVRFRGDVPLSLTLVHAIPMFAGLYFVILACLLAFREMRGRAAAPGAVRTGFRGWLLMALGGLPLGWPMNWYAFGVLWEGWPFGADVTDNKTQAALLAYGIGLWLARRRGKAWPVVVATVVVVTVYLIPHSI